jgi:hypothetical protein
MIKEDKICEGCILIAICTKICDPVRDKMYKSRDQIHSILKMKGGGNLLTLTGIPRVDFIKNYSHYALLSENITKYIEAVDYAIGKGYIRNRDPIVEDLNICIANLRRVITIQERIMKNAKRKYGAWRII